MISSHGRGVYNLVLQPLSGHSGSFSCGLQTVTVILVAHISSLTLASAHFSYHSRRGIYLRLDISCCSSCPVPPLCPWQVMQSRGSVEVSVDCHLNPFCSENRSTCCAIRTLLVGGQVGVGGSRVAESYFIDCKYSIMGLFDCACGSEVTGEAVSRNVRLLQVTSISNDKVGLQPDAHMVRKEGGTC